MDLKVEYPNFLEEIFLFLKKQSLTPIIVGGFVRDALLHYYNIETNDLTKTSDIDVEVFGNTTIEELSLLLKPFGKVNLVGKSFGVCKLLSNELEIDFSLPREDVKVSNGHKGFEIHIQKDFNFAQAAKRRDLTINAIGYDPIKKELLDFYGGVEDLKHRVLNAVDSQSFVEDPLRLYRAIGFKSRLGFVFSTQLSQLLCEMVKNNFLKELPRERIYDEVVKFLLYSKKPSIAIEALHELTLLQTYGDSLEKLTQALDNLASNKENKEHVAMMLFITLFALLAHREDYQFFLSLMHNPKEIEKESLRYLEATQELQNYPHAKNKNYLLCKIASKVRLSSLIKLLDAFVKEKDMVSEIEFLSKKLGVYEKPLKPILSGKDILACGIAPSKKFTLFLESAYEAQMQGEFSTKDDALEWLNREIKSIS